VPTQLFYPMKPYFLMEHRFRHYSERQRIYGNSFIILSKADSLGGADGKTCPCDDGPVSEKMGNAVAIGTCPCDDGSVSEMGNAVAIGAYGEGFPSLYSAAAALVVLLLVVVGSVFDCADRRNRRWAYQHPKQTQRKNDGMITTIASMASPSSLPKVQSSLDVSSSAPKVKSLQPWKKPPDKSPQMQRFGLLKKSSPLQYVQPCAVQSAQERYLSL